MAEPHDLHDLMKTIFDTSSYMAPMAVLLKNQVESCLLEKNGIKQQWMLSNKAFENGKTRAEDLFTPYKMGLRRFSSPPPDIFDDKKTNEIIYSSFSSSDEPDTGR